MIGVLFIVLMIVSSVLSAHGRLNLGLVVALVAKCARLSWPTPSASRTNLSQNASCESDIRGTRAFSEYFHRLSVEHIFGSY
jgi:hypothetical protein